ncbi:MAG: hypothetical protein A2589_03465 [Candidatus Vogelbacteria bacterium RIFOXYD1_FULL_46_19]|uniref:DUF5667 domain-containing protein n=1 Tax=Candidatus Vogelbacteria bacterium RIFOXYD1_FULL_46_19 TaxID=1802439 RepID=A0A1G2QGV0_9BACT|nr:MAG: hypothetical protein A2589_03465 [Candidatus Vogelbacteria bacterium RIFOXYD1_FULL_46_19]
MNKTKLGLGSLAVILGVTALSAGSALAYQGDPSVAGPNCSADRQAEMRTIFQNKDYQAWKSLKQNQGRVTQIITEANFAKLVEAHELALEGKLEEAQKIRQELGLGLKNGSGRQGGGMNMGMGRGLNR